MKQDTRDPATLYVRAAGVIETDLEHELVLLDPASQQMFTLNATGRCVWKSLPARGVESLADSLLAQFEVTRVDAEQDARRLLDELVAAGLVEARA